MVPIQIADAHLPHLERLSREYNVKLDRLVDLIIAVGIETLEAVEWVDGIDESIPYELVDEEKPIGLQALGHGQTGEEVSEHLRQTITYIECHYPFEEEP